MPFVKKLLKSEAAIECLLPQRLKVESEITEKNVKLVDGFFVIHTPDKGRGRFVKRNKVRLQHLGYTLVPETTPSIMWDEISSWNKLVEMTVKKCNR